MTFDEIVALRALAAAPRLLGWTLLVDGVGGAICEVEAYESNDPASHTFRGETRRNRSMFGPPGHLYVYRSYGIHWCANIVCSRAGVGAGVLLRALVPSHGLELMRARRGGGVADRNLASGPGRLTQALALDATADGADLRLARFELLPPVATTAYVATPRIGITKAVERPWRFVVSD